jgi:hypothetical protein
MANEQQSKSFVGYTLNLPPDDRVESTAAIIAIIIDRGAILYGCIK